MRVLFIVPYPIGRAPSQRFRFEQYFRFLDEKGIGYDVSPFLDAHTWKIVYKPGHIFRKLLGIVFGYLKRFRLLFLLHKYDFLFVHRELVPFGFPIVGWIICKVFRKKMIYDFDDAIWIPNASEHNKFMFYLKLYSNTERLCSWAYKVSCGNDYLSAYARKFNSNVVYNPTTIDTDSYHNKVKDQNTEKFVIGWTGSHSTIQYLDELIPVFKNLEKKYSFELQIVSDKRPDFDLKSLVFKMWNKETEIEDLLSFNVGIMPLSQDKWAEGKCGFKALQYMALGIPAIVSPVGVNTKIVDHNINGFVCSTTEEWEKTLAKVMEDRSLLIRMSEGTRPKIIAKYSVQSNKENFLKLFS